MKLVLTLAALATTAAIQPAFAASVALPDAGTTGFLALISVGGLILFKNIIKK